MNTNQHKQPNNPHIDIPCKKCEEIHFIPQIHKSKRYDHNRAKKHNCINKMIPSPLRYCSPVNDHEMTFEQNAVVNEEIAAILRRSSPNPSFKSDSPFDFDELRKFEEFGELNDWNYGNTNILDEFCGGERCENPGIVDE